MLVPLATLLSNAFTGGFSAMWDEITDPETFAAIRLALICSAIVVVVNTLLGTLIAWQLVRDRFVLNRVISAIVDLPFALPTIVAGVVLLSIYGPGSPFHIDVAFTRWSLVLALSFVTLPFAVRSVQPVLAALDREAEEAAASLGASRFTTFRRIILPRLAPALLTGAGLAFARALGEYGSVSLISGDVPFKTEVASVRIYGLIESDDLQAAAARLARALSDHDRRVDAAFARPSPIPHPGGRPMIKWLLRIIATLYVGMLVGVPVGSIVYRALKPGLGEFFNQLGTPSAVHALVLTLEVAGVAVTLNTIFGLGVAILLARHRFRGASLVEALIDLPLSLSPVVIGLALMLCYSTTQGLFGPFLVHLGITVLFSFPGIVMACAFVSLPYVVREVQPVLIELGTDQEQAAETLGAGPFTVFWRITLPSVRWGLAYGVLLTTARVLGEFGAVAVVSGNIEDRTQTMTLWVDSALTNFNYAGAYAGALLLALISTLVLAALSLSRSKEGRLR